MDEILRYPIDESEVINMLEDAIFDADLKYTCKDLYAAGIETERELRVAILKSIQVIKQAGLSPQQHFKHLYVTNIETGKTFNDWRISKMGLLLVLMHASGNNQLLNKWKIEIARKF